MPVKSFYNNTANCRVHASITFLVYGDERPLLVVCFLEGLEVSPFQWRRFYRYVNNRLSHAFSCKQNVFYKWCPDSKDLIGMQLHGCDVLFRKLQRNFFCFRFFAQAHSTSEATLHISLFHACATRSKVASIRSSTKASILGKNQKGPFFSFFSFQECKIQKFERL